MQSSLQTLPPRGAWKKILQNGLLLPQFFLLRPKTGKKQPLAKMRPRVKCSLCEFSGREGQEMRDHVKKEHQTEFKCKECQFRTKYKIVRRRHMLNAHKKPCERC